MKRKRPRFIRVGKGYKCPKCEVKVFPIPKQFYRHWDKVHSDAESNSSSSSSSSSSGGSGTASSGSDVQRNSGTSSAEHSGITPGAAMPIGLRSASVDQSVSRAASQGVAEEGVVAAQVSHPGGDAGIALVPEHVEGELFYDAVGPMPPEGFSSRALPPANVLRIRTCVYSDMHDEHRHASDPVGLRACVDDSFLTCRTQHGLLMRRPSLSYFLRMLTRLRRR